MPCFQNYRDMKKATIISLALIVFGFVCEILYFATDGLFFKAKFWILGLISIVAGAIGLWLYTALPWLERKAGINGNKPGE